MTEAAAQPDQSAVPPDEGLLRESEARHRLLIESLAQARWETDAEGVVVKDSPSWRAYTGQTLDEWLGYGWLDAVHPDDRAHAERQWREAVAAQALINAEFRLRSPGGSFRWTNVRAAPVQNAAGTMEKWVGINIDVDARKRAEAALRESEERQAFLLQLSDTLRPIRDPILIMAEASALLGRHLAAGRCGYGEVDDSGQYFVVHRDWTDGVMPSFRGTHLLEGFGPEFVSAYRAGRTVLIDDALADARAAGKEAAFEAAGGVRASLGVPMVKEGRFVAGVFVQQLEPRHWTAQEETLAIEVAERTWDAVERARAEQALRESDMLRRVAVSGGRMGTWHWDLDAGMCGGDAQFMALWGFPPADAPRPLTDYTDRMTPEGAAEMAEIVSRAVAAGEEFDGPLEIVAGPTAGNWVRWRGRAVDESGRVLDGVTFDITEQKLAELALRESEERQAFLLKLSDRLRPLRDAKAMQETAVRLLGEQLQVSRAGYYEVEADQNTFYLTARWEQEVVPLPDRMLLTDFGEDIRAGYRSGRTMIARDTEQDAASAENLASVRAIKVRAWIGVPLVKDGHWVAAVGVHSLTPRDWTPFEVRVVEEVAERTWAAVERARAEEALRESEERFREFGENSSDVLWVADLEAMRLEYLSPAFERIWGESRDAVLGDYAHWANTLHPDDRGAAMQAMPRLRAGRPVVADYRIIRPDGEVRAIRDTGFPMRGAGGRVTRAGGISQDITDIRKAQERQRLLLAELQHQVRNILGMVRSLARQSLKPEQSADDYLAHLLGRIDAMARTQVLLSHDPDEPVDLQNMVRDELQAQIGTVNIARVEGPEVKLAPKAAEILALALHELATNSVKYGVLGGEKGAVEIWWATGMQNSENWLTLHWQERGVAIADVDPAGGFGTELIERRVPYELGGRGLLRVTDRGVRAEIAFPLRERDSILETGAGRVPGP